MLDDIGRARDHGELVGGFKSVAESLETVAAKMGLQQFGKEGEPFDPTVHEALMHSYSPDVTETTCVQILQPGYRIGERTIRPARVAVAEPQPGATARRDRRRRGDGGRRRGRAVARTRADVPDRSRADTAGRRDAGDEHQGLRREGLLQGPRRPEGRHRGRDQEGVPQARPRVPPGRQQGRRQGRGALQGDLRGLRRARRPQAAQGVRRGARPVRQRRLPARRPAAAAGGFNFDLGDLFGGGPGRRRRRSGGAGGFGGGLGDVFGGLFNRGAAPARVPSRGAARTSSPR